MLLGPQQDLIVKGENGVDRTDNDSIIFIFICFSSNSDTNMNTPYTNNIECEYEVK